MAPTASIEIKGMRIGGGIPKTIVSVMAAEEEEAIEQARRAADASADCIELRADFCTQARDAQAMVRLSASLKEALPQNPIIFTLRTQGQGGRIDLPMEDYLALNRAVIQAQAADIVDVEIGVGDARARSLCALARESGVVALLSHHNLRETPSTEELRALLERMQDLGAGICKVATTAQVPADALRVLQASSDFSAGARVPALCLAMGGAGSITRLTGELFGSCMTFCALDAPSAPGQVPLGRARHIIQGMHQITFGESDQGRPPRAGKPGRRA